MPHDALPLDVKCQAEPKRQLVTQDLSDSAVAFDRRQLPDTVGCSLVSDRRAAAERTPARMSSAINADDRAASGAVGAGALIAPPRAQMPIQHRALTAGPICRNTAARSFEGATTRNKNKKKRLRLMFSTTLTYARMIIELLIAIFLTGLFAAVAGGGAYVISQIVYLAGS
jgi:hypothetical protein